MRVLFNKDNNGSSEIKKVLTFINADLTYNLLEIDIELNTPDLSELVSEAVYNKIANYYHDESTADLDLEQVLKCMQIYIATMAYFDFAANNELTHSNTGRKVSVNTDEKQAWGWQIDKDNAAMKRRAYKALDLIFKTLNKLKWTEWTQSKPYNNSQNLFVRSTADFDAIFPINKSGQLYYRLAPFMPNIEAENTLPILGFEKTLELKNTETPTESQNKLLTLIRNVIVYKVMAKSYETFPVEMFAKGLVYNEDTRMKAASRAEVAQNLKIQAEQYKNALEDEFRMQNQTYTENETMPGIAGDKYINL